MCCELCASVTLNIHVKGKSKWVCMCCPPSINDYSTKWFSLVAGHGVEGLWRFRPNHLQPVQIKNTIPHVTFLSVLLKPSPKHCPLCSASTQTAYKCTPLSTVFLSSGAFNNIKVKLWHLYPMSMSPGAAGSTTENTEDCWSWPSSSPSVSLFIEP